MFKSNSLFEKLKTIPVENKEEIESIVNEIADKRFGWMFHPDEKPKFIQETLQAVKDRSILNMVLLDN